MISGIRATNLVSPRAPRRPCNHPPKCLHHPRHCPFVAGRHVPEMERHNTRSCRVPADYLRPVCRAVGVCHCVLGWVEYVEAESRYSTAPQSGVIGSAVYGKHCSTSVTRRVVKGLIPAEIVTPSNGQLVHFDLGSSFCVSCILALALYTIVIKSY